MTARAPRTGQAGFTLIELMISLVLFSFAIAGVLAVAVSMTQGLREQRAAVGAETSARVPLDFMGDAIRQASPAVPSGVIWDAATCTQNAITVTDNQSGAVDTTLTGWDKLDVIFASGGVVASSESAYTAATTTLTLTDTSQLAVGDTVVATDTNTGTLLKITGIAGTTVTVASPSALCSGSIPTYAAPFLVIRAMHATFTLDTVDTQPTLLMDPDSTGPLAPQPLAEGIEDMQIAQGYDNGAGVIENTTVNGDQWWCNVIGESQLAGQPAGTLRALRISITARTTSGLVGNLNPYTRPAVENHTASLVADQFRRRVLNTTIEIRNLSKSP
ncbi:MAG TPA: PilW family protein [Kofleriaceae bacterium]|nr:PilW family protein [Kofleriaceae bacterium]